MPDFKAMAADVNVLQTFQQYFPDLKPAGAGKFKAKNPARNDKNPGSFILFDDGGFSDFATEEKGSDIIATVAYVRRISMKEAAIELGVWNEDMNDASKLPPVLIEDKKNTLSKLEIVPDTAPPFFFNKPPDFQWEYRNACGEVIGYILRFNKKTVNSKGKFDKTFKPLRWINGKWEQKGFPKPLPIYGADLLADRTNDPILIVSGEKTADVARLRFPEYVCITWPGGDQQARNASWKTIAGRDIVLLPDNDDSCKKAMARIQVVTGGRVVAIPEDYPVGWDVADAKADENLEWIFKPAESEAIDYYSPLPLVGDKGKPLNHIANLTAILQRLKVTARYDIIRKRTEILATHQLFSGANSDESALSYIESECSRFDFPISKVDPFLQCIANQNPFNPIKSWIESKPWDGISRFKAICDTIETLTPQKDIYIRRWMISAIAAAYSHDGVCAQGVLVLQGDQYLGKTSWFKSLLPSEWFMEGAIIRPDNKDIVKQIVSRWIVEIGELDVTFRKADVAQLKAFITKQVDTFRLPYARKDSHFERRTVFCGSVNPCEFLSDDTGNRRYWVLDCKAINARHDIDVQQMWAEVMNWYKRGESHYLTVEELKILNESNKAHETSDPIEDRIMSKLAWNSELSQWRWATTTEVLLEVGIDKPTRGDTMRAKPFLLKVAGKNAKKKILDGTRLIFCPPKFFI